MTNSQLIKDIAQQSISIEEGLERLLIISYPLDNKDIKSWIVNELNGFSAPDRIPSYRKNPSYEIKYSGINGPFKVDNQILPFGCLPNSLIDEINKITINENISFVQNNTVENHYAGMNLMQYAKTVYDNSGIQCYNIRLIINASSFVKIISNVKTKLILILLELEKQFGNLDNLDIEVNDMSENDGNNLKEKIKKIEYDDNTEFM